MAITKKFRFQELDVWQRAAALSKKLFEIADKLESSHKYRFAEQLRSATLSITNNIAEGSGSLSVSEFKNFLNISRRSTFEVASMLVLFGENGLLADPDVVPLLTELEEVSKMTLGFMKSLKSQAAKYQL
ncbi:MAG: four helix bundle protein [Candidatus Omnitrophica bacterium]|nr:four helix bundle protein [Candidatus Omnitrophota bacterium]